jgi:hypothetical protein
MEWESGERGEECAWKGGGEGHVKKNGGNFDVCM